MKNLIDKQIEKMLDSLEDKREYENDNIIGLSSMCFDLSVYDIFGALSTGATLYIAPDIKDTDNLLKLITTHNITFWNSVPSIMNLLIENLKINNELYKDKLNSLKNVLLSGDWIPIDLPEKIHKFFPQAEITSLGGATEGSIWSIYYPIKKVNKYWKSIPYGMPLSNQTFYVLREDLDFCPISFAPISTSGTLLMGTVMMKLKPGIRLSIIQPWDIFIKPVIMEFSIRKDILNFWEEKIRR